MKRELKHGEPRECVVCKKTYYVPKGGKMRGRVSKRIRLRGINTITCSRKCSKRNVLLRHRKDEI